MAKKKTGPSRVSRSAKPARSSKPKPSSGQARPAKPAPKKPALKTQGSSSSSAPKPRPGTTRPAPGPVRAVAEAPAPLSVPIGPQLVLSLSFVRDGDEFTARMEGSGGHVTELKNRSLDQLLTLVAGELEDLLG